MTSSKRTIANIAQWNFDVTVPGSNLKLISFSLLQHYLVVKRYSFHSPFFAVKIMLSSCMIIKHARSPRSSNTCTFWWNPAWCTCNPTLWGLQFSLMVDQMSDNRLAEASCLVRLICLLLNIYKDFFVVQMLMCLFLFFKIGNVNFRLSAQVRFSVSFPGDFISCCAGLHMLCSAAQWVSVCCFKSFITWLSFQKWGLNQQW